MNSLVYVPHKLLININYFSLVFRLPTLLEQYFFLDHKKVSPISVHVNHQCPGGCLLELISLLENTSCVAPSGSIHSSTDTSSSTCQETDELKCKYALSSRQGQTKVMSGRVRHLDKARPSHVRKGSSSRQGQTKSCQGGFVI